MEKRKLKYIKTEKRENDGGFSMFSIFLTEDSRRLAIKHNKVISYLSNFKEDETYYFYLEFGGCQAIQYGETIVFNWGGRVIMRKDNVLYELNTSRRKKPLTEVQLSNYIRRFFEKNGN